MLLILVPNPLNECGGVSVVAGAYGCVETCYQGRVIEGGCCGVYIHVRVAFHCVKMDVWDVYWFLMKHVSLLWG